MNGKVKSFARILLYTVFAALSLILIWSFKMMVQDIDEAQIASSTNLSGLPHHFRSFGALADPRI